MTSLLKMIRDQITDLDSFSTTQFLRYKEDPEFKTLTGGICTVTVIIMVILQLFTMSIQTIKKQHIQWNQEMIKVTNPTNLSMAVGDYNFMFGIGIEELDLNNSTRYFDFEILYRFRDLTNDLEVERSIQMERCSIESWAVTPEAEFAFQELDGACWLCPKPGQQFDLLGKQSTMKYSKLEINIKNCTEGTVPNTSCSTSSQKTSLYNKSKGQLHFGFYYINTIVNPNDQQSISYYIDDSNYVVFNDRLGGTGNMFLSDFEVRTDQSLLPITEQKVQKGVFVKDVTRLYSRFVSSGCYSSFILDRSPTTYKYTRSFRKIDYLISYAGGLIGAVIGLIFVMNIYTKISFELCLGASLFRAGPNPSPSFNILKFLSFGIFNACSQIGCQMKGWKSMRRIEEVKEEIQKQLDVKFMLERLLFLERGVEVLLGTTRFKGLHLSSRQSLDEVRKGREMYEFRQNLSQQREAEDSSRQEEPHVEQNINQEGSQSAATFFHNPNRVEPLEMQSNKVEFLEIFSRTQDIQNSIKQPAVNQKKNQNTIRMLQNDSQLSTLNQSKPSQSHRQALRVLKHIKQQVQGGNSLSKAIWNQIDQDIKIVFLKEDANLQNQKEVFNGCQEKL